eukprot:jgi/Ulvmu1/902/UM101_0010.1
MPACWLAPWAAGHKAGGRGTAGGLAPEPPNTNSSGFWGEDTKRRAALDDPIQGIAVLQTQHVRYSGCQDSTTPSGWLLSESTAARTLRCPSGAPLLPRSPLGSPRSRAAATAAAFAPAGLPQQVHMSIATAPAKLCMPIKKECMFKPAFQVQVRVMHALGCATRLPLRVKAFAVLRDRLRRGEASEWLPCHATSPDAAQSSAQRSAAQHLAAARAGPRHKYKKAATVPLKGATVLSHCFAYTPPPLEPPQHAHHMMHPQHAPVAHMLGLEAQDSSDSLRQDVEAAPPTMHEAPPPCPSHFRPLPMWQAAPHDAPGGHGGEVVLEDPESLVPRSGDPDLASPVQHGEGDAVSVAQFEFRQLKFEKPSRMTEVQMVFACTIGGDLLYCVYHVPTICISRCEQRATAVVALGLPRSVYDDVGALATHLKRLPPGASVCTSDDTTPHPAEAPAAIYGMHARRTAAMLERSRSRPVARAPDPASQESYDTAAAKADTQRKAWQEGHVGGGVHDTEAAQVHGPRACHEFVVSRSDSGATLAGGSDMFPVAMHEREVAQHGTNGAADLHILKEAQAWPTDFELGDVEVDPEDLELCMQFTCADDFLLFDDL